MLAVRSFAASALRAVARCPSLALKRKCESARTATINTIRKFLLDFQHLVPEFSDFFVDSCANEIEVENLATERLSRPKS